MPESTTDKPKRKAMFLGPEALLNLKATSARRRTEREAMEDPENMKRLGASYHEL